MKEKALNIMFAGGGTGGHLFPGIAVANAFIERNPGNRILFVGTGRDVELSVISKAGFDHRKISVEGIKGRGWKNQAVAVLKMFAGIIESIRIIRSFSPDLVFGLGGYSAGPVVIAAWLGGVRIVLQEQNILPGMTNRFLSLFADRVFVSFKSGRGFLTGSSRIGFTGNPVRKEILAVAKKRKERKGRFSVLVIGGSQGAHAINMAVIDAMNHLKNKENFHFIHQTGPADLEAARAAYEHNGISCETGSFFDDMACRYKNADLVVCRAGATTISEITAVGKAAVFIPYPHAANNHQELNAKSLVDRNAAEMIVQRNLTGKLLAERLEHHASAPQGLEKMAVRALECGNPNAAADIVNCCCKITE